MAKGLFSYDPRSMEFRRRERSAPWAESPGDAAGVEPVAGPGAEAAPVPQAAPDGSGPQETVPAPRVIRPEGYVDPTPVRRRRRRKSRSSGGSSGSRKESAWRGLLWGLILIMAVIWVLMIYTHEKDRTARPQAEKIFTFEREEVVRP